MNARNNTCAVVVTSADAMQPAGGGVQRCTREYLAVARAAGFSLEIVEYPVDRHPLTRLRRKFVPQPYQHLIPPTYLDQVIDTVHRTNAGWIFLNQVEPGLLAPPLAAALRPSGVRLAMLSHGADSSDYLHEARVRANVQGQQPVNHHDEQWLGRQLFAEFAMHDAVDVVFCLCDTDREHARWLGGKSVHVLPRLVENTPLPWNPIAGRIGTVSTLVHAPNVEGIVKLAEELAHIPDVRLRLIGGPAPAGHALARQHRVIDYLGPLSDDALAAEAASWCAFANPIFCQPRGCSTKLAVPLSWRLPVATTRAGARGYVWDESIIPFYDTPVALARESARLAQPDQARAQRPLLDQLAGLSPQCDQLADLFRSALA